MKLPLLKERWIYQIMLVAAIQDLKSAAKHLKISVSTLKKHLSQCEKTLQTQLFIVQGNTVELTPAGDLFVEKSKTFLARFNTLENLFTPQPSPDFKVGYSDEISQAWLTQWVRHSTQFDNTFISMSKKSTLGLEKGLLSDDISIAVSPVPIKHAQIKQHAMTAGEMLIIQSHFQSHSTPQEPPQWVVCGPSLRDASEVAIQTDLWHYALTLCLHSELLLEVPEMIARSWLKNGSLKIVERLPHIGPPLYLHWRDKKILLPLLEWTLKDYLGKQL